jgi:HIRAN domain
MARSRDSEVCHFHTKIVGVTYQNSDGSYRQKLIRKCRLFESLLLDHEEDNPHDANAVRVCRQNGQQLGYLDGGLAEEIVRKSNRGYRFATFVKEVTGGRKGEWLGVNLLILQAEPGVNDRQVKNYLRQLIREDPELDGANVNGGCSGRLLALAIVVTVAFILCLVIVGFILYLLFVGRK